MKTIGRKMVLWMFVALLVIPAPVQALTQSIEPESVLLLYDSLALGTSKEGNIDSFKRLLAAYGVKVTVTSYEGYQKGVLSEYSKVIGIRNMKDLMIMNVDYNQDFDSYSGDYLHIGSDPPAQLQAKLGLQLDVRAEQVVHMSIEGWRQASIYVNDLPLIVQYAGTAYGQIQTDAGKIQVPYGVRSKGDAYVPYYERDNLSEIAMGYVLRDWLHKEDDPVGFYLLIKEIYPFSDLQLVEELADKLYAAGIPFIASVRPVFSNLDYPAMKRYIETLTYIQSRNGSILVNEPFVASKVIDERKILQASMETFVDVLAENGVAPLGIGAELYWTYDRQYAERSMEPFDSVVLFPNEKIISMEPTNTSKPFHSSLYGLSREQLTQYSYDGTFQPELPMDSVLILDNTDDSAQNDIMIQQLMEMWVTFKDYKLERHTVQTKNNHITSDKGMVYINRQAINMAASSTEISSNYEYREEEVKSFTTFFQLQNQIYLIIISITLVVFGILFMIGRSLYRRKYLNNHHRREL